MDNVLGFIASIDVTDLEVGLSQVKKAITQTKADFDNATAGLEKWQKSSQGVGAKLTQLKTQLEAQNKAVDAYKNEIERVSKLGDDNSGQLEILQEKLKKAEIAVAKTQTQINKYSKSFETLKKKEEEENSANAKFTKSIGENQNKLKDLESQYKSAVLTHGKYSKEAKEVASQVKKTSKELKNQEDTVKKLDSSFGKLKDTSSTFKTVGKALLASFASIGAAVGGLVSKVTSLSDTTKEFRDNQTRLATAWEDTGKSAESLEEQYTKLYSIIGDDSKVTEALAYLAQLKTSEEDLDNYTESLIGVYAKFGDAIPINELSKNINEAIKTGEVTGQLGDAIKQVGRDEETFKNYLSSLSTEEERQQLILSYLTDNYTDLGKAYRENNQGIIENNENNLEYQKTLAKVGELGEDVKNKLIEFKTKALETIYPAIQKIITIINNNWSAISGIVGPLTLATATIKTLTIAMGAWSAITKTATAIQTALNATLLANPFGVVITAVVGLTTAAGLLIKNWEKVKNFFASFWSILKSCFNGIKDWFLDIFEITGIKTLWENLLNFFKEVPAKIVSFFQNIGDGISAFFSDAWEKVKEIWSNPGVFFANVIKSIVEFFETLPAKLLEIGKQAGEALVNGVKSGWEKVKNLFTSNDVEVSVQARLEMGQNKDYTDELIENAKKRIEKEIQEFKDNFSKLYNVSEEQIDTLLKKFNNDTEKVAETLKEMWENGGSADEYFKNIEGAESSSFDRQLTEEEKFIQNSLNLLSEKAQRELELASSEEDTNKVKEKYSKQLEYIKGYYNDTVKAGATANSKIEGQIDELGNKLKTTIGEASETASQTFTEKLTSAMQNINSQFQMWGGQISSYFSQITGALSDYWQAEIDLIDTDYEKFTEELEAKQSAFEEAQQAEIDAIEKKYEEIAELDEEARQLELDENAQKYLDGSIDDKEYFLNKYKIEEKYNTKAEKDTQAKDNAIKKSNKAVTNYAKQLEDEKTAKEKEALAEKNRLSEKQFNAEKANDIAQVWIKAALAIVSAYASNWILGIAATIAMPIIAGIQTAAIAKQSYTPITAMAKGGIVDEPTYAMVGEAGQEAVLPLENNTGWIETLAEKLNTFLKKDFNIANYGSTGEGAIYYNGDTINNYNYNQTINSPTQLTRAEIYRDSKSLLSLKKY